MSDWQDFPLPDGSYKDAARPWSQQDVVNLLPLPAQEQGARSRVKYTPVPGLDPFANIGTGPHRGAINVEGALFVVSGDTLFEVAKNGTATSRGTIPGTGRVCMAYNQITSGNQLVIGNGSSGYVYNTVTGAFTQITDDGFVGFKSCDFLNQYIVGVEPLGRFWYHSELVDALSYNTHDRYFAETSPDPIKGLIGSHNQVLVFGSRTIEPWVNDPENNAAATAFQLQSGSVIERGCLNGNTIRRLDNSVFFIGDDRVPYRLDGYTPRPIGTPVLADAWRDLDETKLFAFTYEDKGHVVYYVTWGDGQTWGYDVVTGKWHRRQSFGLNRWRLNTLVKWGNEWVGGDFHDGRLFKLRWGFMAEANDVLERAIVSGVLHADGNPISVAAFQVTANTGLPPQTARQVVGAMTIAGDLPDGATGDAVSYSYTVTRAYPGQAYSVVLVSGTLPAGVSMSAAGVFSGTRTTVGEYEWVAELRDEYGRAIAQVHDYSNTWAADQFDPEVSAVKYKVLEPSDSTDYSSPSYDDSAWGTGRAPFGNSDNAVAASVGFQASPNTLWPLGKTLWYRANLALSSTAGLTFDIYRDDYATVWVNGTMIYDEESASGSGLGAFYDSGVAISSGLLVVGNNSFVIRSKELYGGHSFLDYRLHQAGYVPPSTPSSAPSVVTALATSSLSTGRLRVRYSKDGVSNRTAWRNLDVGGTGNFLRPLIVRQLGQATHRVWEINDTSEYPADILAAAIQYA
jgi:hypothetical protein